MKKPILIFACLLALSLSKNSDLFAQDTDSLKLILKGNIHDTTRCDILGLLVDLSSDNEWPKYNEQQLQLSFQKLNDPKIKGAELKKYKHSYAQALANRALFLGRTDSKAALIANQQALKLYEEMQNDQGISDICNNIGFAYHHEGNLQRSIEYFLKSLKMEEKMDNSDGIASVLNNLAFVYGSQGEFEKSLESYVRCLKIKEKNMNEKEIAITLNNIGALYDDNRDFNKALVYYQKSLRLCEKVKDTLGTSNALNNIGWIYFVNGDSLCKDSKDNCIKASLPLALDYFRKSLKLSEMEHNQNGIALSLNNIGAAYFKSGQTDEALTYARKAMQLAKELEFPENINRSARLLFEIYKTKGNYKLSLENYELYIKMRDSVTNAENKRATIRSQLKYDFDKKSLQDSVKNAEKILLDNLKYDEEIKQQRLYTFGGVIGFALMMVIAAISFRAFRNKKKANDIISSQKKLVEHQKELVEEKQREILDSIHYAHRIQKALITNEKYIDKSLQRLCDNDKDKS